MKTLLAMLAVAAASACSEQPVSSTPPSPSPLATQTRPSPEASGTSIVLATPTPSPSPFVYVVLPVPRGTARCRTDQLEIAFLGQGAALGNVGGTFEVRNKSLTGCWVFGYVGFQTLDRNRKPLPQTLTRSLNSMFGRSDPPSQILLPSRTAPLSVGEDRRPPPEVTGHAFFRTATDDVLCNLSQFDAVTYLEIWPPDEYSALVISSRASSQNFIYCGSIGLSPLEVRPFQSQS
jgi:hypothetical protein